MIGRVPTSDASLDATRMLDAHAAGSRPAPPQTAAAGLPGLIGNSPAMHLLEAQIRRVAVSDATVLIIGESGTGKEAVAQAVHALSPRAGKPFVAVNCGAIAATLIEAELLGHERGSFTGADRQRPGYFERADGGTLFLDEVSEMPLAMQVKLLRVLEEQCFHRVGGTDTIRVDVRVVAATNRDLARHVADGLFREDLMYRLAVIPLRVPSLHVRSDDIPLLARHFLDQLNATSRVDKRMSAGFLRQLQARPWTGNVRELKNVISRAHILADSTLDEVPLAGLATTSARRLPLDGGALEFAAGTPLADVERELILAALARQQGDKRKTAESLGIGLKTLYSRLRRYRIAG